MSTPDFQNLLDQAQKMQENMQKAQEQLMETKIIGHAGGDLVEVHLNGRYQCTRVVIDPGCMEDDVDVLEDLVAAAINDASNQIEKLSQDKIMDLTAGVDLPEGFDLGGAGNE